MFTGLIETLGRVINIQRKGENLTLKMESSFTNELSIDESVAHNGICLTIEKVYSDGFQVSAIKETIEKTNIANWSIGDHVNLERALKLGDRLGGHIVQGHIDGTAKLINITDENGSKVFTFHHNSANDLFIIEKGSIAINGISLTIFNLANSKFSVAIIPYTYEHTTFQFLQLNDIVNIEYDILGKYFQKSAQAYFQR